MCAGQYIRPWLPSSTAQLTDEAVGVTETHLTIIPTITTHIQHHMLCNGTVIDSQTQRGPIETSSGACVVYLE